MRVFILTVRLFIIFKNCIKGEVLELPLLVLNAIANIQILKVGIALTFELFQFMHLYTFIDDGLKIQRVRQ